MGIIIKDYDFLTFLEKRKVFLEYISKLIDWELQKTPNNNKYSKVKENLNYITGLKLCEMHDSNGNVISGNDILFEFGGFDKGLNTRRILPTELRIEFDSPFQIKNIRAFYSTCENLINKKIHFCVFYALGQKSPHIIIYDALPKDLDNEIAYQSRLTFCRSVVPMEFINILDRGLLQTGHKCCLEFAKHWRHGTMFKLMFEHLPKQKPTEEEIYYQSRGVEAFLQ